MSKKVTPINASTKSNVIEMGSPVDNFKNLSNNNGNGGGGNMDDKYVTHEELKISNLELRNEINKQFEETRKETNTQFKELNKQLNELRLDLKDTKNTANSNKEKINWLLYTVVGGIIISVFTTVISNLITK